MSHEAAGATRPLTILVVDDDIDLLEQVSAILQADGHTVVKAHGQEEGEEALLSCIPDLAVVDLMMEHQDSGFVLCHRAKRLFPEVPVILLTAVRSATGLDFSAGSDEAASWTRADVILDKPVRPEQLRGTIRRLVK